jgi:hypothetical protein
MPQQQQDDDDRDRHAEQPQQNGTHGCVLRGVDDRGTSAAALAFRIVRRKLPARSR